MFKKKNYFLFFLGILVPISLTLNVISSSFIFRKLFNNPSDPFSLRHLKNKLSPPKEYSDFHKKNLVKFDIEKIISIEDIDSANLARSKIINFLWGEEKGFPTNLPKIVEKDHYDESYADINELDQINKITIVQDFDINSIQYHFIPKNSNNRVVIYHQGHDGDFIRGKHIIKSLLKEGYSVLAISPILLGKNNQPVVFIPNIGKLKLWRHEVVKFLKPLHGHNLKYFLEPVLIGVNYLETFYSYKDISMVGFSAGGWTTQISSAIDQRISNSFAISGSYPIAIRDPGKDWSDYEMTQPDFYRLVNYLDIYILGAFGKNRKQYQIINKYDPCCWSGTRSKSYEKLVQNALSKIGNGMFTVVIDDSHSRHIISPNIVLYILSELRI